MSQTNECKRHDWMYQRVHVCVCIELYNSVLLPLWRNNAPFCKFCHEPEEISQWPGT